MNADIMGTRSNAIEDARAQVRRSRRMTKRIISHCPPCRLCTQLIGDSRHTQTIERLESIQRVSLPRVP
jgi:hypothetical protein